MTPQYFTAPIIWRKGKATHAEAYLLERELRDAIVCCSHIAEYEEIREHQAKSGRSLGYAEQLGLEREHVELEIAFRSIAAALGLADLLKERETK